MLSTAAARYLRLLPIGAIARQLLDAGSYTSHELLLEPSFPPSAYSRQQRVLQCLHPRPLHRTLTAGRLAGSARERGLDACIRPYAPVQCTTEGAVTVPNHATQRRPRVCLQTARRAPAAIDRSHPRRGWSSAGISIVKVLIRRICCVGARSGAPQIDAWI